MTGALHLPGWNGPIPVSSGSRNLSPSYAGNLPPGATGQNFHHLEAQAAGAMRAQGAGEARLFISGNYVCGGCTAALPTMLPSGATLTVIFRDAGVRSVNCPSWGVDRLTDPATAPRSSAPAASCCRGRWPA